MTRRPPPLAGRVITWSLAAADRDAVLGDLQEEFAALADGSGAGAARRWYWTQTLTSVGPNLVRRTRSSREKRRLEESDSDRLERKSVRTASLWLIGLIGAMAGFAWVEVSGFSFFVVPMLFIGVFLLLSGFVPVRRVHAPNAALRGMRNLILPSVLLCSLSFLSNSESRHLLTVVRAVALPGWAVLLWPERYWPLNRSRRPPSR